jgi:lysophospholipase L1-like esterase
MRYSLLLLLILSVLEVVGQTEDWANLRRYSSENDSLLSAGVQLDVVLMGNSITDSWPDMRPEFFEKTGYLGRGIGGQTTPQMLVRFRQDVIAMNPKVVVILAGTNDIAGNTGPMTLDQIMDNLKSMVELATANGIRVILASVLPAYDYKWRPGLQPNVKIPQLNSMIQDYCKKNSIEYLDYFSVLTDGNNGMKKQLTYDGVHPNVGGYKVMEPLLEEVAQKALKK